MCFACLPEKRRALEKCDKYFLLVLVFSVLTIQDCSDTTVLSHVRRVAYVEDFFEILHRVHCQERGHVGYKKLLQRYSGRICFMNIILYNGVRFLLLQISACYECLQRSAVQKFVSLCPLCSTQKVQRNQAPLKPIIASGFMSRGQVSYTLCTAKQS